MVALTYGRKDGQTYRLALSRGGAQQGFEITASKPADELAPNAAVNEQGVGVELLANGELAVFSSSRPGAAIVRWCNTGLTQEHRAFALPAVIALQLWVGGGADFDVVCSEQMTMCSGCQKKSMRSFCSFTIKGNQFCIF